jgi:cytochrome c5
MEHLTIKTSARALLLFLVMGLLFTGCYKDNEEDLYPTTGNSCNTDNVSYSQTVLPILDNSCVSCHAGAGASGGVRLDSHSAVAAAAASGKLLGAIKHESGFSAMPQGAPKLSDCNISTIEALVQQGSQQN